MKAVLFDLNIITGGLTPRHRITIFYYESYISSRNYNTAHKCTCNTFKNPGKNKFTLNNLAILYPGIVMLMECHH